ncbi:unnamed protein product [Porites evermanni]|uniref:Uncharacterized protein n=1 Tax=Porites evermanni TaxID=104178 RepID=A0ABN8SNG0_9CNID|nr:unnamed protein product [Porites evermanni]
MEAARSGLWAPGWYVYSKLRYWAYFLQQSVATEYLHLTEDNNRGRKDYYLEPHDSDPTVPVTRADVYDRRSSENIANNPLPPLPADMEDQFDPESEERP